MATMGSSTGPSPAATTQPAVAPPRLRGKPAFVWSIWALLSAGLVGYVWLVNDDFPIADDWHLVAVYTGKQPVNLSWLWAQYNDHRMPLPKLLLVLGGAATGHDYRAGVLISALGLSALAALMIVTAGRLRGGVSLTDAFFPLILLHWGQSETLLISFALNLVASTVLAGVILCVLVRLRTAPTLGQGVIVGLSLLALPLCGSNGAVMVPPLALWLGWAGVLGWRSGSAAGRRNGAIVLALALASLLLLGIYLAGLHRGPSPTLPGTPQQAAVAALAFLSSSAGALARIIWPISGILAAGLLLTIGLRLRRDWRQRPGDRLRTLGLLSFGGALLCLAAGIGFGRGGLGALGGLQTRYITLAAPLLCLAYFLWRAAVRPLGCAIFFVAALGLFAVDTPLGLTRADERRARMRELQADVANGMTSQALAEKWGTRIFWENGETFLTERFEMLRRARQGPYGEPR